MEKDKRRTESTNKQQAAAAALKSHSVNNKPDNNKKNDKKSQRPTNKPNPRKNTGIKLLKMVWWQLPNQPNVRVADQSFCVRLFMLLLRLSVLAGVSMGVVFALNWQGPLTLDNAGKVAQISIDKVSRYSIEIYDWASPHLQPIQEQLEHLSRFVAKNGRELAVVAWDKAAHYGHIGQQHVQVIWPVVREKAGQVLSLTGDSAAHYWRILCREAPIYYDIVIEKINQLIQGTQQTQSNNRS